MWELTTSSWEIFWHICYLNIGDVIELKLILMYFVVIVLIDAFLECSPGRLEEQVVLEIANTCGQNSTRGLEIV